MYSEKTCPELVIELQNTGFRHFRFQEHATKNDNWMYHFEIIQIVI